MHPVPGPIIFDDIAATALGPDLKWEPFHPGVEISRIYSTPLGAASAFLRYSAGAKLRRHVHRGWEHILVLQGTQTDDRGIHPAGSMVIHPPGSAHTVSSEGGCIVLAFWEKPVSFVTESESQPIMSSAR